MTYGTGSMGYGSKKKKKKKKKNKPKLYKGKKKDYTFWALQNIS
tara:strand:- start:1501 stop:1632 length:132 start_codon:yes stop_codon:yes gene_type:complete